MNNALIPSRERTRRGEIELNTGTRVRVRDESDETSIEAGYGSCKSCNCKGYKKSKDAGYCECGHHFSQHY